MSDVVSPWLSVRTDRAVCVPDTSFAPMTEGNRVDAFVGGADAMHAMRDSILAARSVVYVADWIFYADLPLVREDGPGPRTVFETFDAVAKRGVKVFVSLYESVDAVSSLDNGDEQAEKRLRQIPGVQVQRHRPSLMWSHHQKMVVIDGAVVFLGGVDLALGRWDNSRHPQVDEGTWPDPDWYNPCLSPDDKQAADPRWREFQKVWNAWWKKSRVDPIGAGRPPVEPKLDTMQWRKVFPRMPWQDVHLRVEGPSALDVARCFEERWNFADREENGSRHQLAPVAPKAADASKVGGTGEELSCSGARVQVLRSVSEKSYGVATESSILDAYIRLIRGAKRHVYIENQFFISNPTPDANQHVKNLLALQLVNRIVDAIDNETEFRVDIVLPVHSEGDIRAFGPTSSPHRTLFHQNRSLCRDGYSLQGQVEQAIVEFRKRRNLTALNPAELELESHRYLRIHCLRNWAAMPGNAAMPGKFSTEQIYVHTKLMVVDDRIFVVGSANINDRSLLGGRDSEIAVVVEDPQGVDDSWLADEKVAKGALAYRLRKALWRQHWGADIDDPLADFHSLELHRIAEQNTRLYESIFPALPADQWTDFDAWKAAVDKNSGWHGFGPAGNGADVAMRLGKLRGHVVLYPRRFLRDKGMDTGAAMADIYT